MSLAAAHIWHKPSERAAWMKRFVIVSDSAIRIYSTRNDHEQHKDPMYYVELLTTTNLLNGSNNIVFQGWMNKKGKIYWNARWCALVNSGYLNYVDQDNKHGIRSIDIQKVKFVLDDKHNGISWKNDKNDWFQFRCDNESIQQKWHEEMLKIQKNCVKIRMANAQNNNKEPTLFAFMIRKPIISASNILKEDEDNDMKSSKMYEEHCFCADSFEKLEQWRKVLIEQIAASNDVKTRSRNQSKVLREELEKHKRRKKTHKSSDVSSDNKLTRYKESIADTLSSGFSAKRHKQSMNDDEYIDEYYENISDTEINDKMNELMNKLKIPKNARGKMLSLDRTQKIKMLQQHALKQIEKKTESGKTWSYKFASYSKINISILQQFSVVLRDETDEFLKDFIQNLGLNHLCRLATKMLTNQKTKNYSSNFDIELLRVFKAIIDANEYALTAVVKHNISIRIIVEKIDSKDIKVSELALSLLVTMVGIENENDEISILASNKILSSLKDLASSKGQRNRYKVLISHMSIKDVLNGSFQYDTYAVTLINYLIMGVEEIQWRMEERRLLNALQFDKILDKLEDRTRRKYNVILSDALMNQIETYRKLYETDKRNANEMGAEIFGDFDIDNPMDLFKRVHDQALHDGYINELVAILKNLIVLPSTADTAWLNVAKIVNTACKPAQKEIIKKSNNKSLLKSIRQPKMTAVRMSVWGPVKNDDTYVSEITQYPTYDELYTMLEIREAKDEGGKSQITEKMQKQLDDARQKQLQLEDALVEEKSKNLSLETQLIHLKKHGTGTSSVNNSRPSIEEEKKDENKIKPAETTGNTAPAVAVDDGLNKYRKMLKFKMPKTSIVNKMRQDGVDKSIIKQFEDSDTLPGGNAIGSSSNTNSTPQKPENSKPKQNILSSEDEKKLSKYKKMQKLNMPKQSIINRMRQDGISIKLIGLLYPDELNKKSGKLQNKKDNKPKLPSNLKEKEIIKPKNKMKNLHWTKVNPFDVSKTIWNNIDDESIQFNAKELESKFCWKTIESKQNDKKPKKEKDKSKNEIVRVLDTRRAYNIEIFLGRLRMDSWTLREAMLSMNEDKIPLDTVHKLINFVPTTDESQQLNGYENEKNLGVAENFIKIIRTVDKNLVERLTLWEFKMEFTEKYSDQKQSLVWLRNGHDCIKKSVGLKLMFTLILKIGNYMNGSTSKGQAYGFKIGSLSQLMRSRTVDNSATLMEYIYEFVNTNNNFKQCLQFTNDLNALEDVTTVDITILRQNISGIGAKLRMIRMRIENKENIARMGDKFIQIMKPFYINASKQFEELKKQRDLIFNDLKLLGEWLNEARDANFKFLKTLNEFRLNFLNAIKITKHKKTKALEIEKRKKWKENKNKKGSKKGKGIVITVDKQEEKKSNNNNQTKEEKLDGENRESIRSRRGFNDELKHSKNISDVVIQTLTHGSSYNFVQRLQTRARNASKIVQNQ